MVKRKTMGIIFANMHDPSLGSLTGDRSFASVPFGGRYRLVDFSLSSMVHGGIGEVGIVVKENYHSLMTHLGAGKEWDLARKIEGLSLYPPFVGPNSLSSNPHGRVDALHNVLPYIKSSSAKYSVLMDCDHICNPDISSFVNDHIDSGADVSLLCYRPQQGDDIYKNSVTLIPGENDDRVTDIVFDAAPQDDFCMGMNISVLERELLIDLIENAHNHRLYNFERDVLQPNLQNMYIRADHFDGFVRRICSVQSYFNTTMSLLDTGNRNCLFLKERSIYTKVNDDAPVRYGINAKVVNSLIADGCVIEGSIENSVLFRGVKVAPDVQIKNSIIMQNTELKKGASVNYVMADRNVEISAGRTLMGYESYPLYIQKRSIV